MHGDDVRVPQPRHDARLAFEPIEKLRIVRQLARQHLHRHFAIQAHLPPKVDRAHATTTERHLDFNARHLYLDLHRQFRTVG